MSRKGSEMAVTHDALRIVIRGISHSGIPVAGYCVTDTEVILLVSGGSTIRIALRDLGERPESVVASIMRQWNGPRVSNTVDVTQIPQIDARELVWWRFLRWLYLRGRLEQHGQRGET